MAVSGGKMQIKGINERTQKWVPGAAVRVTANAVTVQDGLWSFPSGC